MDSISDDADLMNITSCDSIGGHASDHVDEERVVLDIGTMRRRGLPSSACRGC